MITNSLRQYYKDNHFKKMLCIYLILSDNVKKIYLYFLAVSNNA